MSYTLPGEIDGGGEMCVAAEVQRPFLGHDDIVSINN